jgi:hypothetical protein
MSAELRAVLEGWRQVSAPLVRAGELTASHCILGTRTVGAVLTELGWQWEAVPCHVLAYNAPAAALLRAGVPAAQWPPEAWSVGTGEYNVAPPPPQRGRSYPGHVVLLAYRGDGYYLLDASSGQFARPQHRLLVPETLLVACGTDDRGPWGTEDKLAGWGVGWRRAPQLGKAHRTANDWTQGWRDMLPTVRVVADRLLGQL